MKIISPKSATFEPETKNMFEEVQTVIESINAHRPFSSEVSSLINREFIPDRVTASLNMEGISVTRRQTLLMMDAMTITETSSRAEQEVFNALKADELVFDHAVEERPLTAHFVREINKTIESGVRVTAGDFRTDNVEISGAAFQPPDHFEVPQLVSEMIESFVISPT